MVEDRQRPGKVIVTGDREKLLQGVRIAADAVAVTCGPAGKNVIYEIDPFMRSMPAITKDGVTVAKEVILRDPQMNMGAQIVINASNLTNQQAGDGTTTTAILVKHLVENGSKIQNMSVTRIKRNIDKAIERVIEEVDKVAIPVADDIDMLKAVAHISSNGDSEISDICAEAAYSVGKDGFVSTVQSPNYKTTHEIVDGSIIESGYVSRAFMNQPAGMKFIGHKALVLVSDIDTAKLEDVAHIFRALEEYVNSVTENSVKSLIIFGSNIFGEALRTIQASLSQGIIPIPVCICRLPGNGDYQTVYGHDIASMTGAKFICDKEAISIRKLTMDDFGFAETVEVNQYQTVIINGAKSEKAEERLNESLIGLSSCIEKEKDFYRDRLKILSGKIATIHVGAVSDIEAKEKKDRVIDAVSSVKAAMHDGIVPGGGLTLYRIAQKIENEGDEDADYMLVRDAVMQAIKEPMRTIIGNTGEDVSEIESSINLSSCESDTGYDASSMVVKRFMENKIIDPAKVLKCALRNAASVAGTLLTTDVVICYDI